MRYPNEETSCDLILMSYNIVNYKESILIMVLVTTIYKRSLSAFNIFEWGGKLSKKEKHIQLVK